MDGWIDCEERLPGEVIDGNGSFSDEVEVLLSDGTISTDWLICSKWVVHCKKNGGAFPIKWKKKG